MSMANIEDLQARLSLTDEEEQGADVSKQCEICLYRLAAKKIY